MTNATISSAAPRCSDNQVEPLPGSAKRQSTYVILEWAQGWSRDVLDGGVFGADLTAQLKRKLTKDAGLQLIRRPGRDGQQITQHHLFLVFVEEATIELLMVDGPEAILDLDLSGPGRNGDNGAETVDYPLVLVCTHGKRDVCCAIKGRPLAAELVERYPGTTVWETSHTKGHRFAPSILLMPWGYSYGWLNVEAAGGLVQAAQSGDWFHPGNRGRGLYGPRGQVAEIAVASDLLNVGESLRFGDLSVVDETQDPVAISHRDGRRWAVDLEQQEVSGIISSCGDESKTSRVWVSAGVAGTHPSSPLIV